MPNWLWRIFNALGTRLYKLGLGTGHEVLVSTKGARTGQERNSTVHRFDEAGGTILVVGSKGGNSAHPAWFINIAKHPEAVWITVKGHRAKVTPTSLTGEERAAAWKRIVAEAPGFGQYELNTDREIPVVRLTPER
jgi:deazaflavin-dependent oxidoreductase (nitroreductase family)